MKKARKILALIALCAMLCCVLCSCNKLDSLKARQAFWNGNDNWFSDINYNGQVYKKIPQASTINTNVIETSNMVYITEPDVPVLLSGPYGECGYTDFDNRIIERYTASSNSPIYYCRVDIYDDVYKSLKESDFSYYCAHKFEYNDDINEYEGETVLLDRDAAQAIDNTLNTAKGKKCHEYTDYMLSIDKCDKYGLFCDTTGLLVHIIKEDSQCYIYTEDWENLDESNEYEDQPTAYKYPVAEKYNKLIGDVFDEYYGEYYNKDSYYYN